MIELKNITKTFKNTSEEVQALKEINLTIPSGDFVAIMGQSGSGKSTLLHLICGLDKPSSGTITVKNDNILTLNDEELSHYRGKEIGLVFQDFYLQPHLTALENVMIPAIFYKKTHFHHESTRTHAEDLLNEVGLEGKANRYPHQLSGGQKQRVAIARALMNSPSIVLGDEPTGNLDSNTGKQIIELLENLHKKHQTTLIIVTHDPAIAKRANTIIEIHDGRMKKN